METSHAWFCAQSLVTLEQIAGVQNLVCMTHVLLLCRPVSTRGELKDIIVEMSKQAQVGQLSAAQATQVLSEV